MFEYKGAKISARPASIGDNEDIYDLLTTMPEGKQTVRRLHFVRFLVTAEVDGDFPVPPLDASASSEAVRHAYTFWRKLPGTFEDQWQAEFEAANSVPKG